MEHKMFCYQCQETAGCSGCTISGVCGKKPDIAAMQDLLVWVTKGLSAITTQLRSENVNVDAAVNHLINKNLFITITNVNFDKDTITDQIIKTLEVKESLLSRVKDKADLPEASLWISNASDFEAKASQTGVLSTEDEDIRSLRELITYGLKGLSAYTSHANVLFKEDSDTDAFIQRALSATLNDSLTVDQLISLTMETGKFGVQGMALLDQANTEAYGNPELTSVKIETVH